LWLLACISVCKQKAIIIKKDECDFSYLEISELNCVDCGNCDDVCPIIKHSKNLKVKNVHAIITPNKKTGSSVGVFKTIANTFVLDGGIVFGAAFDENLQLKHFGVENADDLLSLCRSKYLKSDTQSVYFDIKKHLIEGQKVMFVGTPCQCSAVSNHIKTQ
jgi:coenzyme F420-reducing hydrogenase beta subunit